MLAKIKGRLKELGFTSNEIKVYLAMTQLGESAVSIIAKKADLPRTTVASILLKLSDQKYVSAHTYHGVIRYWVESPKMIEDALLHRAGIARELNDLLSDLYRAEADFPHAEIYDTKKSIKTFIEKTLLGLKKNTVIQTIDTPAAGNYTKIYSDDFGKTLRLLKTKKGIVTHTLVSFDYFKKIKQEKLLLQNIQIREMPREVKNFQASIWIIDDILVLFSGAYPFIVVVRHRIITESFKGIYGFLWSISEKKYPTDR